MTATDCAVMLRKMAENYRSGEGPEKDVVKVCPHKFCGALVPFYAIDRILDDVAHNIEFQLRNCQNS